MEPTTINTDELKLTYQTITSKMNSCIDKMTKALNSEDEEEFEILLEQFSKLRDQRIRYLQKIDMIAKTLEEVANIADEVRQI